MKFLNKFKSFTFLFLFLSFTVFADYKYLSGNDLYTQLTSKNDSDFIIAAEYIAGSTNAFMIDYSIHSGKNRFFVVDLKKDSIIKKELVCHGDGKGKNTIGIPTVFSNRSETHCSSLGMAVMGERAYSSWGKNYKYWIDGLEETNSNMRKRIVVLHGWKGMPNKETYPNPIATSWGCPTVSVSFLDELDVILKENKKVLLYSFK